MLPITRRARPAVPFPPAHLRERATGNQDEVMFAEAGTRILRDCEDVLRRSGLQLADFPVVMDFGCGCGRALRPLLLEKAAGQTIIAVDTDAEAIAWLSANVPDVVSLAQPELPPGMLADSSVDLVLAHDVFAHFPEQVQLDWLAELRRVTRPGGMVVISVLGKKMVEQYAQLLGEAEVESDGEHLRIADQLRAAMDTRGFYHLAGRAPAEAGYPEYYGVAFHTVSYIAREWLRWFDLIGWYPAPGQNHQDFFVLQRGA